MNTSYTIRKKSVLYLLLGNNRAIAGYTKARVIVIEQVPIRLKGINYVCGLRLLLIF
ncbi:hypothetical protein [Nostoc flagelliforme]|uniref:hypothetical protein n=1 Tax=Nostoc flagelliforme TaxID=1306274 RepID=UPI0012FE7710|nr:hypothetical protein [Nostoc flagelliforme]